MRPRSRETSAATSSPRSARAARLTTRRAPQDATTSRTVSCAPLDPASTMSSSTTPSANPSAVADGVSGELDGIHLHAGRGEVTAGHAGEAGGEAQRTAAPLAGDRHDELGRRDPQVEQLGHVRFLLEKELLADHGHVEDTGFAARQQVGARREQPADVLCRHKFAAGGARAGCLGDDRRLETGLPKQSQHLVQLRLDLEADAQAHGIPSARNTSRHEPSALRSPSSSR